MRSTTLVVGVFVLVLTLASTVRAQEDVAQPLPAEAPSLFVRVLEPSDDAIDVPGSIASMTVRAQTLPDAIASVDGVLVPVDAQGLFVSVVRLYQGVNVIDVVASTADGAQADLTLIVIRRDDQEFLQEDRTHVS